MMSASLHIPVVSAISPSKSLVCSLQPATLLRTLVVLLVLCSGQYVHAQSKTATAAPACERDIRLTPGDAMKLQVYPDSSLFPHGVYTIDDRGCARLPIIGPVEVTAMSLSALEEYLRSAYVDYLPHPHIQVEPRIRVSMLGGFYRPGLYYMHPRSSLWEVIKKAGGTQREDGLEKIVWERNHTVISDDIIPYYESGASLQEIGFRSGDQLHVTAQPRLHFWEVMAERVLPMINTTVSLVATSLTAYLAYEAIQE